MVGDEEIGIPLSLDIGYASSLVLHPVTLVAKCQPGGHVEFCGTEKPISAIGLKE